jgi:hypothetical protein
LRVLIENRTAGALPVPAVSAVGPDFTLRGELPPVLDPAQSAYVEVIFTPVASGERLGALAIGARRIPLRGFGTDPPLPGISLIAAAAVRSAEQHIVRVRFEAPLRGAVWGELAIGGAGDDDTLVFANGAKSVTFQALPGEQERSFAYQTGATAGPVRFMLRIGERLEETIVHIAEEPVRVTGARGNRDEGGVALRLTALDNTLTTSLLTYTFFDRAGKEIGRWSQDYAESFFHHFRTSRMGGVYSLFMRFPVTGDVAQVDSVRVELTNRAGVTVTDRIAF